MINIAYSHFVNQDKNNIYPFEKLTIKRLNTINSTKNMKLSCEPRYLKQMPTPTEKESDQSRLSINSPLSTSTLLEFETEWI